MTHAHDAAVNMFRLATAVDAGRASDVPGRVFRLDACFETGGAWAGIGDLIEAAYLGLVALGETAAVTRHDYELYMALPQHRDRLRPRYFCLTDTATGIERTRFYPVERAYRLVHGLVGLVLEWKQALGDDGVWHVVVANFDEAQHLVVRFVAELARRAGSGANIEIFVQSRRITAPGDAQFPGLRAIPAGTGPIMSRPASIDDLAAELLIRDIASENDAAVETHFPSVLQYYRHTQNGAKAAALAFKVLAVYNRRGYYHEAKSLIPVILPHFDGLVGTDQAKRMSAVSEINSCLVAAGDGEQALQTVGTLAMSYITQPQLLANLHYIFAMHHLRYLGAKDTERAEHYLLLARDNLRATEGHPGATEQAFLTAFIDNGLAFLRVRQNRPHEALELCETAYQHVTRELGESRHLLHRSVLQFNTGQVHVMLGDLERGLACYREAIDIDPFYAEYHAESGSILEQLGRIDEAIECYGQALRFSPSYPAVMLRKAICHALREEWQDALSCSGLCLELAPDQPELYAARAEMLLELGRPEAALAEYDRGIAISDDAIALRVNRAVLHFNNGAYDRALADMETVISREPGRAAHYENRAAIYQAIERPDLHRRDLELAELCAEVA